MARELFGGGITTEIPGDFDDISKVRVVPDHQEVFANQETDQSIIVEILEYEKDKPNELAARYYFQDLAQANEAVESSIEHEEMFQNDLIPNLVQHDAVACGLVGTQSVSKFKESASAANQVKIYLAVVRLPKYETDILVTMNVPVKFSTESSSAKAINEQQTLTALAENPSAPGLDTFMNVLKTFKIINPSFLG